MFSLTTLMMKSTVSLHFRASLWHRESRPAASVGRKFLRSDGFLVFLDPRNESVVEIIAVVTLSPMVGFMTCQLWLSKSFLIPHHLLPPPHAASLCLVTALVTCSGELRFPVWSTLCSPQSPTRPPLCHHGTWLPHWRKSCPPGKPVIQGIPRHPFSRPGHAYRTCSQRCLPSVALLHPKGSCRWSSARLRKAPSSYRLRAGPVCLPKNLCHVGRCLRSRCLMGSHLEEEWVPVKAAGSRRGLCLQPLSLLSPCLLLQPRWCSQWDLLMKKMIPATSMLGSAWLPSRLQFLLETVLDM